MLKRQKSKLVFICSVELEHIVKIFECSVLMLEGFTVGLCGWGLALACSLHARCADNVLAMLPTEASSSLQAEKPSFPWRELAARNKKTSALALTS